MCSEHTYDEVGVDTFHVDALAADLLIEGASERGDEGLGAGVGAKHG